MPAGTLDVADDGTIEDPDAAAPRELEEETGMRAGTWRQGRPLLHRPGVRLRGLMHLYLATDLRPRRRRTGSDRTRTSTSCWNGCPWREAIAAAERGEIADAKSLVALLWLGRLRATR